MIPVRMILIVESVEGIATFEKQLISSEYKLSTDNWATFMKHMVSLLKIAIDFCCFLKRIYVARFVNIVLHLDTRNSAAGLSKHAE